MYVCIFYPPICLPIYPSIYPSMQFSIVDVPVLVSCLMEGTCVLGRLVILGLGQTVIVVFQQKHTFEWLGKHWKIDG